MANSKGVTSSLPCPFCGHKKTYVLDARGAQKSTAVRRRRICYACNNADPKSGRFTTYERIEIVSEMVVIKNDGRREPFSEEKLLKSLRMAFTKRNVTEERLHRIVFSIISVLDIRSQVESNSINYSKTPMKGQYIAVSSKRIGALVLNSLRELDDVAYIRYASIFLNFHDRNAFQRLVESLGQVTELPET